MTDEPVTLDVLAAQLRKIHDGLRDIHREIGAMRDDMRVLTAIVLRLDHAQAAMLDQLRAMVQQHNRFNDRLRVLEAAREGPPS